MRPAPSRARTVLSPIPSMFIASREAKCASVRSSCAGQDAFPQRTAASPSSRATGSPQEGQTASITNTRSPPVRFSASGPTTSGIMSPALRTSTRSPMRTPREAM